MTNATATDSQSNTDREKDPFSGAPIDTVRRLIDEVLLHPGVTHRCDPYDAAMMVRDVLRRIPNATADILVAEVLGEQTMIDRENAADARAELETQAHLMPGRRDLRWG